MGRPPRCTGRLRRIPISGYAGTLLLALLLASQPPANHAHAAPGSAADPAARTGGSQEDAQPVLGLPEVTERGGDDGGASGDVTQIPLGGKVALDKLGPAIVAEDGTLRRIANWDQLTPAEQRVALRRIAQRNQERLEQLRKQQHIQQGGEAPSHPDGSDAPTQQQQQQEQPPHTEL